MFDGVCLPVCLSFCVCVRVRTCVCCVCACDVAGISYSMDESERAATMSRIETKKSKEKKNYLSALPASSEEILEGQFS